MIAVGEFFEIPYKGVSVVGHFLADMAPDYAWGNSPADSTYVWERVATMTRYGSRPVEARLHPESN